jgi:hypothetical protein
MGGGVQVKSSMEAMLDSLMRRDEKPRDVPPALPPRPPSRGRLPSARRSLPPLRFSSSEENLVLDPSQLTEVFILFSPTIIQLFSINLNFFVIDFNKGIFQNQADIFVAGEGEEEKENEEVEKMEVEVDATAEKEEVKEKEEIPRSLKAEKELKEREEEMSILRQQLLQFQAKCSDYEAQLKRLQDQLSLQQQQQHQQQQAVCIQVCFWTNLPKKVINK